MKKLLLWTAAIEAASTSGLSDFDMLPGESRDQTPDSAAIK